MPLRDHFQPPLSNRHRWDAVHGQWPAELVRTLFDLLPAGYVAEPQVHHPAADEIDVAVMENEEPDSDAAASGFAEKSNRATMTATEPTLTIPVDLPEPDEYEVRVYDVERERRLVAVIELVSPANKDRPRSRELLVFKLDQLLRQGVSVSIVDIVTSHDTNFYGQILARLASSSLELPEPLSSIYAVTVFRRRLQNQHQLQTWYHPLQVGEALPTLPLWLGERHAIPVPLEPSYQEVCRLLRIA